VIDALGDLYCATPRDLARYIRHQEPTDNDLRSTRATIKNIYEHDDRATFLTQKHFFFNSATSLFGLSSHGAYFAKDIMGIDNAREFEIKDAEHEHLITRFHIALRELAAKNNWQLEWKQQAVVADRLINPDAIATLTTEKGAFTFCIEPERQSFTENHLKKAKKYHSVFGKPECKALFGADKVRVIFIVLSERKRQTMLEKFAEEYPYRMFWFTTVDAFTEDIGGEIFKTPKDFKEASYSFISF